MKKTCEALRTGALSHFASEEIFEQLAAEGKRRIDAFVFEISFQHRLKTIVSEEAGMAASFGWHIGYNRSGQPSYWFKLMSDAEDWNSCDEEVLSRIQTLKFSGSFTGAHVVKVTYDRVENKLYGSRHTVHGWAQRAELTEIFGMLPGKSRAGPVRAMDNRHAEVPQTAFTWLRKPTFRKYHTALSIQRRFMNCELAPNLGKDGTDIDAFVLTPAGDVVAIEFKRKYPARGAKFFGLDVFPHVQTINTMQKLGVRSLHFFLVPPRWDKGSSAVSLLDEAQLEKKWTWLAADVDRDSLTNLNLSTSGEDSGQRSINRSQLAIKWKKIKLLNEGIKIDKEGKRRIIELLHTGALRAESVVTYEYLESRQDKN